MVYDPTGQESPTTRPLRRLDLSGWPSPRASSSTATLRLQGALPPRIALHVLSPHGAPLYNEDDDGEPAAEPVPPLRSAIETSDGVIMISRKDNHGMSGVLQNALDWASRLHGRAPPRGRPVLTMTAPPAFTGGMLAQQRHMNETRLSVAARLVLSGRAS